jgi:hypothetical protein
MKITKPTSSQPIQMENGTIDPRWYQAISALIDAANASNDTLTSLVGTAGQSKVVATKQTDSLSIFIEFPDVKDYVLKLKSTESWTISNVTTRCTLGGALISVACDGTALGGGSSSVAVSKTSTDHSTLNTLAIGGDLVLTVRENSACEGLAVTITYAHTLATS